MHSGGDCLIPSTERAVITCCACRFQKVAERKQARERGPRHCWSGTCIYSTCRRQWWPTMVGTGDLLSSHLCIAMWYATHE